MNRSLSKVQPETQPATDLLAEDNAEPLTYDRMLAESVVNPSLSISAGRRRSQSILMTATPEVPRLKVEAPKKMNRRRVEDTTVYPRTSNTAFFGCLVASVWRRLYSRGSNKPESLLLNPPRIAFCSQADFQAKLVSLNIPNLEISSLVRLLCGDKKNCPLTRLRLAVSAAVSDSDKNFASKPTWLPADLTALGYPGDALASLLSAPGLPVSGRLLARWAAQSLPGNLYFSVLELLQSPVNWRALQGRTYTPADAAILAADYRRGDTRVSDEILWSQDRPPPGG